MFSPGRPDHDPRGKEEEIDCFVCSYFYLFENHMSSEKIRRRVGENQRKCLHFDPFTVNLGFSWAIDRVGGYGSTWGYGYK